MNVFGELVSIGGGEIVCYILRVGSVGWYTALSGFVREPFEEGFHGHLQYLRNLLSPRGHPPALTQTGIGTRRVAVTTSTDRMSLLRLCSSGRMADSRSRVGRNHHELVPTLTIRYGIGARPRIYGHSLHSGNAAAPDAPLPCQEKAPPKRGKDCYWG
jgi:hypothetical protein